MPYDPNDPRITAYALGELDPEDCALLEAELADSLDSQQLLDDIRTTARILADELRNEPSPGLSEVQRRAIEGRLNSKAPVLSLRWLGYAAAASLLIASDVVAFRLGRSSSAPEIIVQAQAKPSDRPAKPSAAQVWAYQQQPTFDSASNAQHHRFGIEAPSNAPEAPAAADFADVPALKTGEDQASLATAPAPRTEDLERKLGAEAKLREQGQVEGSPSRAALARGLGMPGSASGASAESAPGQPAGLGGAMAGAAPMTPAPPAPTAKPSATATGLAPSSTNRTSDGSITYFAQQLQGPAGMPTGRTAAGRNRQSNEGLANRRFGGQTVPPGAGAALGRPQSDMRSKVGPRQSRELKQLDASGSVAESEQIRLKEDGESRAMSGDAGNKLAKGYRDDQKKSPPPPAAGSELALGYKYSAPSTSLAKDRMPSEKGNGAMRGAKPAEAQKAAEPNDSLFAVIPPDQSGPKGAVEDTDSYRRKSKGMDKLPAKAPADGQNGQPALTDLAPVQLGEAKVEQRVEGFVEAQEAKPDNVQEFGREAFPEIVENDFKRVQDEPLSTFSIDVDTASYANVRRFLSQSVVPPKDSVRVEEMVNYFRYQDPEPTGDLPFSANVEIARCPWNADHRLARIGLKGRSISYDQRKASNLVFLIDVSGSMEAANKLPLLKSAMRMLVESLGEKDRVAIVVYAAAEGLALPSTSCYRKGEVLSALDQLQAGGSTNGGAGIKLAYDIATDRRNFIEGGINRVILCTDGDFNVGVTGDGDLNRLIEEKRKSNVFLTVLGFGEGNLQEAKLKGLASHGNGNYHYIDTLAQGQKVLVEEGGSTLVTIAKDVKIQVEFNPSKVSAFRQIGYELRQMAHADFNNDAKDAGEIGAGHSVTALYEFVPAGKEESLELAKASDLLFQERRLRTEGEISKNAMMVRIKYKRPTEDKSQPEIRRGAEDTGRDYAQASDDFKFSAAVASFGLVLRDSKYKGNATLPAVEELAKASIGANPNSYRSELIDLIHKAQAITKQP